MMSKNFFTKMIMRNIKGRSVWVLISVLIFLVLLPVQTILNLDNVLVYMKDDPQLQKELHYAFAMNIGYQNEWLMIAVVAAAFILGMTGFWYLYSGEKTDFYHSLPIRREGLFFVNYISGLLIFAVPYGVNLLAAYGVGCAKQAGFHGAAGIAGGAFCANLVFFLIFYNLSILSIMLTGNLFTGTMGYLAFLSYGALAGQGLETLSIRFFDTFFYGGIGIGSLLNNVSPVMVYFGMGVYSGENPIEQALPVVKILLALLAAAVLLFLCVLAYRLRPSESYHKAIAFRKLEPVIKVGITIPLALLGAILLSDAAGSHTFVWFMIAMFFSAVVLFGAMDFLYTMDLRECFRFRAANLLILVCLGVIAVVYRFDLTGYDTYLPKKDKIESMSVYIYGLNDLYSYPDGSPYFTEPEYLKQVEFDDFEQMYDLARMGVEAQKTYNGNPAYTDEETNYTFSVKYHLKSGKKVYRSYTVRESQELNHAIGEIYDNWEFKEKTLPVEFLDENKISEIELQDLYSYDRRVNVTEESKKQIFKTYKSEWEHITFQDTREQKIIGFIQFRYKAEQASGWIIYDSDYADGLSDYMPVYEGFTKTRDLLKQLGFDLYDITYIDEIEKVEVIKTLEDGSEISGMVTEKEEMEEILKNSVYDSSNGNFGGIEPDYSIHVNVYWKDGIGQRKDGLYLISGKMPKFLEKAMKAD